MWPQTDGRRMTTGPQKCLWASDTVNRVRPHQLSNCLWIDSSTWIFPENGRNCLTFQSWIVCLFRVPTSPPCNSPAMILTTDCYYLLDHLLPGLQASWGRGSCLPHATFYPQYWVHVQQIEVTWEIFAKWKNEWVLSSLNRISHCCFTEVACFWPRSGRIWLTPSPHGTTMV